MEPPLLCGSYWWQTTLPCNVLEKVAPCIITTKGSSALCSWLSAMEITISLWLILGSMAVTTTVVFSAIQRWGKHLKMAPSIFQLQHKILPGCDQLRSLPYFIFGDEIFALKPWLMCPYPGRNISEERSIFNYRLSRARGVIENCFGILVARWRIFWSPIQASVKTVVQITQATVCLHSYLRQTESAMYCPTGFVDSFDSPGNILPGEWQSITLADGNTSAMKD